MYKKSEFLKCLILLCLATNLSVVQNCCAQNKYLNTPLLKGSLTHSQYEDQVLYDEKQAIPKNTKINLSLNCNLNSQISKVGDKVIAKITGNVGDGPMVSLPGNWYVMGKITQVSKPKRLGRNGYVSVEFDHIQSPDGMVKIPFNSKFSTRDNKLVAVSKIVATDTVYVSKGAIAGAIISTQMTGIPLAIASHGYSVAIGAGVGASIGLFAALKRKGEVAAFYPTDEIKLVTNEPIACPSFLPSKESTIAEIKEHTDSKIALKINKYFFQPDPLGDKSANLLYVNLTFENNSKHPYYFYNLIVLSDHNQIYYPAVMSQFSQLNKEVKPNTKLQSQICFSVDSRKRKYFLVLVDKIKQNELARSPIN